MKVEAMFGAAMREHGGFMRVSKDHPCDLFIGIESGMRMLMLTCTDRPPDPPRMAALTIERRQRNPGWALVVRLERVELQGLFSHLADDLITATATVESSQASAVIVARLVRWQRLLAGGRTGLLDDDRVRGLACELSFLVNEAAVLVGAGTAVNAWRGPLEAPKDFFFASVEVEVKARHSSSKSVRISSLEQLADAGLPIILWTRVVELVGKRAPNVVSLAELVANARRLVAEHPTAWEVLELLLIAAGYEDRPEYEERLLWLGNSTCYAVGANFPRLQRTDVPMAISDCQYVIDLASIAEMAVPSWLPGVDDA